MGSQPRSCLGANDNWGRTYKSVHTMGAMGVPDIKRLVSRLASKASQLIGNFKTNLAENWMNIRAKFDGGKIFNHSQAGSWEFGCMGAGIQLN